MYGLEEQLHVTCSSDMALWELYVDFYDPWRLFGKLHFHFLFNQAAVKSVI